MSAEMVDHSLSARVTDQASSGQMMTVRDIVELIIMVVRLK